MSLYKMPSRTFSPFRCIVDIYFRRSSFAADMSQTPTSYLLSSDALSHITFSSCAAVVARCVSHPLDTLKTKIQYASSGPSVGQLRATFRQILQQESFTALYRGLPVALVFSVPALSVYLGAYDVSKTQLARWGKLGTEYSTTVHALSSCFAEILSGAFW